MTPKFFKTPLDFRKWLEKNHLKEKELIVGFYKVNSGKKSINWSESVDQALCYGWIDGIRRSIDEESYSIRFTPRRANSIWSNVNLKKMEELDKKKLIQPAGYAIFEKRKENKSGIYSFEKVEINFSTEYVNQFKKNKKAWVWYQKQAPSYKKGVQHWVMSAKQDITQEKRLAQLILDCENERKIKQLSPSKK